MKIECKGKVVKGLGGLYDVRTLTDGALKTFSLHAKGALRRGDEKVLIGDNVTVRGDTAVPDDVVIADVLPRKNALIRPPMANLDVLFVVFAAKQPAPVLSTVDKLISIAEYNGITPSVIVTKSDLSGAEAETFAEVYRSAGFDVFVTSPDNEDELRALSLYIEKMLAGGKTAAFAGASGVGKSSLVNRLFPGLVLPTAAISHKIERGRHTTRHVELYPLHPEDADSGFLADTPGFSLLDFEHFDFFGEEDLFATFREFAPYAGQCRYADCAHNGEGIDECAIARAAAEGKIAPSRLESYRSILTVLKSKDKYK